MNSIRGGTMVRKSCIPALVAFAALLARPLAADVYRVGPGEDYRELSQVAGRLAPGDLVQVTGDISGGFLLANSGTHEHPITISGVTRVEGGRIVRPVVDLSQPSATAGVICRGAWNVIEGLEFSGARGSSFEG